MITLLFLLSAEAPSQHELLYRQLNQALIASYGPLKPHHIVATETEPPEYFELIDVYGEGDCGLYALLDIPGKEPTPEQKQQVIEARRGLMEAIRRNLDASITLESGERSTVKEMVRKAMSTELGGAPHRYTDDDIKRFLGEMSQPNKLLSTEILALYPLYDESVNVVAVIKGSSSAEDWTLTNLMTSEVGKEQLLKNDPSKPTRYIYHGGLGGCHYQMLKKIPDDVIREARKDPKALVNFFKLEDERQSLIQREAYQRRVLESQQYHEMAHIESALKQEQEAMVQAQALKEWEKWKQEKADRELAIRLQQEEEGRVQGFISPQIQAAHTPGFRFQPQDIYAAPQVPPARHQSWYGPGAPPPGFGFQPQNMYAAPPVPPAGFQALQPQNPYAAPQIPPAGFQPLYGFGAQTPGFGFQPQNAYAARPVLQAQNPYAVPQASGFRFQPWYGSGAPTPGVDFQPQQQPGSGPQAPVFRNWPEPK